MKRLILIFSIFVVYLSCSEDKVVNDNEVKDPLYNLFTYLSPEESGIEFKNELRDSALFFVMTYEYAYNGSGVAIGDINNDGLQDVYLNSNYESGKLFLNLGDFKFRNITLQAGVTGGIGLKTGVCMVDLNGDGFLDIYITKSGRFKEEDVRKNVLYINNGDLTFHEAAHEFGLDDMSYGTQAYFADIDVDGDLDAYLVNHPVGWGKQDQLNIDIDDQGKYYIVQDTQRQFISDRLLINENGKFIDKSVQYGIDNVAFGLSAFFGDLIMTITPDLYVCNDYIAPDALYINQKGKAFKNEILDYFDNISTSSMGSDYFDINNDGNVDIFTSDMMSETIGRIRESRSYVNYDAHELSKKLSNGDQFRYNALQIFEGHNKFSNVSFLTNTFMTDWSWSALGADFDNNGYNDLFITNGYLKDVNNIDYGQYQFDSLMKNSNADDFYQKWLNMVPSLPLKNYLYKNNGNMQFENVRDIWNGGVESFSNGAAFGDLDNDGDIDLVVNNLNQEAFIMKNELDSKATTNYISVVLQENDKNYFALGAKIRVNFDDGSLQFKYFNPIRGYMSSNEYRSHFGFDKSLKVTSIDVTWPDGTEESFTGDFMNKIAFLSKGKGSIKKSDSNENTFYKKSFLAYRHSENNFIDFKREPLLHLKNSVEGPSTVVSDFNGDKLDDIYFGGSSAMDSKVYLQKADGSFVEKTSTCFTDDMKYEDTDVISIDVDGDGDQDLLVSSGGYEYEENSPYYELRLYINDGQGGFTRDKTRLPYIRINSYCLRSFDYDGDGDLDVMVGAGPAINLYPNAEKSVLLENNNGHFSDKSELLPDNGDLGIVKSIQPINIEGGFSLIYAGDWNPISLIQYRDGKFEKISKDWGLEKSDGWWQTLLVTDIDGDGDDDVLAGNLGLNSFFKASAEKPTCLYSNDFDHNGENDPILCTFYGDKSYPVCSRDELLNQMTTFRKKYLRYRDYAGATIDNMFEAEDVRNAKIFYAYNFNSSLLRNTSSGFEFIPLPVEAQMSMVKSIHPFDDAADSGQKDYFVAGNFWDTDYDFGKYDASIGVSLHWDGSKFQVVKNTGIVADGNVRKTANITIAGKPCLLITENNAQAYTYCPR